jgi:hypothetical protein
MTARRSCWIFAQMRKRSIMRSYVRGGWFTFYPSLFSKREGLRGATFSPVGGRLDDLLPMRLIFPQFRSFCRDQ